MLPLEDDPVCSLIMIHAPPGKETVWFAKPVTPTLWPLTTNPSTSVIPLMVRALPQNAFALLITKPALMVLPATVRLTLAMDASDWLALPPPMAVACNTSPKSNPGTETFSRDAWFVPPVLLMLPVSASATGRIPSPFACTTVARPPKVEHWAAAVFGEDSSTVDNAAKISFSLIVISI